MPDNTSQLSSIIQNELLIITDLETQEIVYSNENLHSDCKEINWRNYPNIFPFFENFIHPGDVSAFIQGLTNLKMNEADYCKKTVARLRKNSEEDWEEYIFHHRPYNAMIAQRKNLVLTTAEKANSNQGTEKDGDFRKMLENIDEAFCVFEMIYDRNDKAIDYLFLETNPAFNKLIGRGDYLGQSMRELIPDHEEFWFEVYGKVGLTGQSNRFQYKAEKIHQRWFDCFAYRRGEENSRQVAVLFRNITEEKKAELNQKKTSAKLKKNIRSYQEELKESKELLQTVFDSSNLGIAVLEAQYDQDGTIKDFLYLRINQVLKEMYQDKDPLGKTLLEVSKYNKKLGVFTDFCEVMITGKELDKEIHFDQEDKNLWFRLIAKKHKELLITTIEDITKAKLASQELMDTLRFKRHLVRTTPETIMIINLNSYSIRYINKDLFSEMGMTKERIEGKHLAEVLPYIHPQDREKLIWLHRTLLKSGEDEIHDIEIRLNLDGTTWEWFSVRGKIFERRDENWVNEYVLLIRNINKYKATQKALIRAERFSIQGDIARTLGHELRNPIASIGMAAEVLNHKINKTQKEEFKNYFEILSRSTKRLNKLVGDLLNASNYSPTVLKTQDLGKIVEAAIEKASDRIYLAGIELKKNFCGEFPVSADKEKLEIAILNILVNASEATPPENGIIEIGITSENSEYILSIRDNGRGMEKEEIDRLFDAFYTSKKNGTGIGLNSVKNIIEEHDAKIEVCSKPEKGSTFRIYFHKMEV